jgi:hypothetical protein
VVVVTREDGVPRPMGTLPTRTGVSRSHSPSTIPEMAATNVTRSAQRTGVQLRPPEGAQRPTSPAAATPSYAGVDNMSKMTYV